MKNKLGITEGEWITEGNLVYSLHKVPFGRSEIDASRFYCSMYADNNCREAISEIIPNAKLIADAGNTAQKCGLLPSELLEQRDELIESLIKCSELMGSLRAGVYAGYLEVNELLTKIKGE